MKKKKKEYTARIVRASSDDYTFLGQAPRLIIDRPKSDSGTKEKNLRKSIKDLKTKNRYKANNIKSKRSHSPVYE